MMMDNHILRPPFQQMEILYLELFQQMDNFHKHGFRWPCLEVLHPYCDVHLLLHLLHLNFGHNNFITTPIELRFKPCVQPASFNRCGVFHDVNNNMMFKLKLLFCNCKSLPPWILQSCTTQSMPWIPNIFEVLPHAYPFPTFEVDPNSIFFKNPKLTKTKRMQTLKLYTPNTPSFKCLA